MIRRLGWLLAGLLTAAVASCATPTDTPIGAPPADTTPVGVDIPAIGASSSLQPVGLEHNGEMQVPDVDTPLQAAWFQHSPHPGQVGDYPNHPGSTVVIGHVDGGGQPGIFKRLTELEPGDEVLLYTAGGQRMRFVVTEQLIADKADFPSEKVYGAVSKPSLRLITCTGLFVGGDLGYRDNAIVFAELS